MGYYINIDHSKCNEVAKQIDTYITTQDNFVKNAKNEMNRAFEAWVGEDTKLLKYQWENIDKSPSVVYNLRQSLENYSFALKETANKYIEAQTNSINEASRLPRY